MKHLQTPSGDMVDGARLDVPCLQEVSRSPLNSTPRLAASHGPSPGLDTIPECDVIAEQTKKLPPPTLPKPKKMSGTKVTPPAPPPKPKMRCEPEQVNGDSSSSFQDETCDGSEVSSHLETFLLTYVTLLRYDRGELLKMTH